jgi:enterochelin esterase-like enzyme
MGGMWATGRRRLGTWLICLAGLLAACAPRQQLVVMVITLPPRPTAPAAQAAGPTPALGAACPSGQGVVSREVLASAALGGQSLPFRIYLPPCYDSQPGRRYPVVYLLHGLKMNEDGWVDLGVADAANALIQQGAAPPFIMVMPAVIEDNRMETAFVSDLAPYVDSHYHTLADREHRALGGMSRGAGWAVRIGFKHPDMFGALGLHSLAILLADDSKVYGWMQNLTTGKTPRIYMDIGDSDALSPSAAWLAGALTDRHIAHEWHIFPGDHELPYWRNHLPDYLRWYAAGWPAGGD